MPGAGTDSGTVFVGISSPGDATGTRDGFVVITALDAEGSPAKIPVRLTLNPPTFTITALSSLADGGTVTGGGSFQAGETATVTATSAAGYEFSGWTEDGRVVSRSLTYAFLVAGNRTLIASFSITLVSITTSSDPVAGGATSGGGSFTPGASVTVVATPSSGYRFVSWRENGSVVSSSSTYSFIASASRALVAEFQIAIPTITIRTSSSPSGGGTTAGGGMYSSGAIVTVSATPSTGYTFINWTEGGGVVSTSAGYTFSAVGDRALVANFATGKFTITTSSNPPDRGTTTGGGIYSPGTIIRVSATANVGYAFGHWSENGNFAASGPDYVFTVDRDRTLVANFVSAFWNIVNPLINQKVGDRLDIHAFAGSGQLPATARANVGDRQVSLSNHGDWSGTLDLSGLAFGPLDLVITGIYANGASFSTTRTFIHDRPPTLTVIEPIDQEVGRPSFRYSATCTDDDPAGCRTLTLYTATGIVLASGTSSISGTITLFGSRVDDLILFVATDSRGQSVTVRRTVFIESSTSIVALGEAPGPVQDYRDGRALYLKDPSELVIRTLSSGFEETIPQKPVKPVVSFVTPLGAMFTSGHSLYEWRNGSLTIFPGETVNGLMLDVNERYALYGLGGSTELGTTLYRRDLLTGATATIATRAGIDNNFLGPDGSVAFWGMDYDIYWYRNGATTRLTNDDDAVWKNRYPITDGTSVVFWKQSTVVIPLRSQIIMHDGVSETVLAPPQMGPPTPNGGYSINAGWIAFVKADANNASAVWLRSPMGVLRQVMANAAIEALGNDGTVVVKAGRRRYMVAPGGSPRDVSSDVGRVVWRDPDFILMIGRVVFRIPR